MKNVCWFFGDSFTKGVGCHPGSEYYKSTYKEGYKIWTTIVSEHLNMEENNLGIGGNSNLRILQNIISNINSFKKGDWVIVGSTVPFRIPMFNEEGKIINAAYSLEVRYTRGNEVTLDYLVEEVLPKQTFYSDYFVDMFNNLLFYLNKQEINTHFWDCRDYWNPRNILGSITTDTNGKIKDGHYSWDAHKKHAEIILRKIDNKTRLL